MASFSIPTNDVYKPRCPYSYSTTDCSPGNFSATSGRYNSFVETIVKEWETRFTLTKTIPFVGDQAYDELLSSNVVFLDLHDAAAVNTVLECIARSTPFLINRNCGIEEILPSNYPLFYDNLEHAARLASKIDKIEEAHNFLLNMDKSHIHINTFMSEVISFLNCALV
jgi:hypothetical protein